MPTMFSCKDVTTHVGAAKTCRNFGKKIPVAFHLGFKILKPCAIFTGF